MYMIHHIFLPPKLPLQDGYVSEHEKILLNTTIKALEDSRNASLMTEVAQLTQLSIWSPV
jgi:hypothetical protein